MLARSRFGLLVGVPLVVACAPPAADDERTTSGAPTSVGTSDATTADASTTTRGDSTSDDTRGETSDASSGTDADTSTGDPVEPWTWSLPPGFPPPVVPADNPMNAAKVELGRHLFYDTRLSSTGTYACATCHIQALAFTDGRATAIGESGESHRRNASTLVNLAYSTSLTWAHPTLDALEVQALVPMFGDTPIELGLEDEAQLVRALASEPLYDALFADAFPDDAAPLTADNVVRALSAFQRTIVSGRSPFDEWFYGVDYGELSEAAIRGWEIFTQPPANCFRCHIGLNLTDGTRHEGNAVLAPVFHNIALYDVDGEGAYPERDRGLVEVTGDPADMGKFKVPTLRNVGVTAPYMHDGSIATLAEVVDHYTAGGRTIEDGPDAGVGSDSPLRSEHMQPFELTPGQRDDLVAFLESLTDDALLGDPALSDPW